MIEFSIGVTGQIKALVGIPDTTDQIETVKEGYWACSYGVRRFDRYPCLESMCACVLALVYAESSLHRIMVPKGTNTSIVLLHRPGTLAKVCRYYVRIPAYSASSIHACSIQSQNGSNYALICI